MGKKQSGTRLQLLVVQIKRNKNQIVREAIQLTDYFRKKNENYVLQGALYGSPRRSLIKINKFYLENGFLKKPLETLKDINKIFFNSDKIDKKDVKKQKGDFYNG